MVRGYLCLILVLMLGVGCKPMQTSKEAIGELERSSALPLPQPMPAPVPTPAPQPPAPSPLPLPTPQPQPPAPTPQPVHYNVAVEVFKSQLQTNSKLAGATVTIDGESKIADGAGFAHFHKLAGTYSLKVEAPKYLKHESTITFDKEKMGLFPAVENPSERVVLHSSCTALPVNDNNQSLPKSLPNMRHVVERVADENPELLSESCVEHGGNNLFLFKVVEELRKIDVRWGLNWKRGVVSSMSQDVVDYYRGQGPFEGQTDTFVVDIIGGHCGTNPQPAWIDVTCYNNCNFVSRWTIDPINNCP